MHNNNTAAPKLRSSLRGYVSVLSASLFFFFIFLQINMYNALGPSLISAFHLSTTKLGNLSACYYYATVVFLIPAGLILDRVSTRKALLCTMSITILMTLLFSLTDSYLVACVTRLVTGLCGAFGLLSCIRIAAHWFPSNKMAWVIGLVITIAMIGGMCAQKPFTLLVDHVSWRPALQIDVVIGVVLLVIAFLFVADTPKGKTVQPERSHLQQRPLKDLLVVSRKPQNWLAGCYTLLMNLPIMVLGAIWGSAYLMRVDHLTHAASSAVTLMLFLGTIFGSPIFGYISDKMGRRIPLMRWGALISFFLFAFVVYVPQHTYVSLLLTFLAIGFFTSTQVLSYPLVTESNPPHLLGAAQGLNSMLIMLSGVFQPVFGAILHAHQSGSTLLQQIPVYNYQHAMLMFIVACIVSLLICFGIKEGGALKSS